MESTWTAHDLHEQPPPGVVGDQNGARTAGVRGQPLGGEESPASGAPQTRWTAEASAQPAAAPPTVSRGRCAPTYTRARATSQVSTPSRRRDRRGRWGAAAAASAVATATWPEGKPSPVAGVC